MFFFLHHSFNSFLLLMFCLTVTVCDHRVLMQIEAWTLISTHFNVQSGKKYISTDTAEIYRENTQASICVSVCVCMGTPRACVWVCMARGFISLGQPPPSFRHKQELDRLWEFLLGFKLPDLISNGGGKELCWWSLWDLCVSMWKHKNYVIIQLP